MTRGSRHSRHLIFLLVGVLAFAGCSDLPTKPTLDSTGSESMVSTTESLDAGTQPLATTSPVTTSRTIGLLGGTVRAGDFTVIVPPGAIRSLATVTVSQLDPTKPVVDLSITPASANRFLLPVLLVANARTMNRTLLSVAYISYYNPTTGQWERVAGTSVSVLNLTVTAPLWHFSKYRVESGGKAGW
jgi:hypothetical protein